jgi:hypothetical protein
VGSCREAEAARSAEFGVPRGGPRGYRPNRHMQCCIASGPGWNWCSVLLWRQWGRLWCGALCSVLLWRQWGRLWCGALCSVLLWRQWGRDCGVVGRGLQSIPQSIMSKCFKMQNECAPMRMRWGAGWPAGRGGWHPLPCWMCAPCGPLCRLAWACGGRPPQGHAPAPAAPLLPLRPSLSHPLLRLRV